MSITVDAVVFVALAGGLVGATVARIAFWAMTSERLPSPAIEEVSDEDLVYCLGCGCRHRRLWMEWDDLGQYRCSVCCLRHEERMPTV